MNVRQLISELTEREPEIDIEIQGIGPIEDIEMTNDGRYVITGGDNDT